jgi:hypothetical protein
MEAWWLVGGIGVVVRARAAKATEEEGGIEA